MKIIIPQNELFAKLFGEKKIIDTQYTLPSYCLTVSCLDGLLIYNNLSKELILLSKEEEINFKNNSNSDYIENYLKKQWFLMPSDTDFLKLCDQLLNTVKMMDVNHTKNYNHYTIMTTLDCNARCFYCFQKDKPHPKMDLKTANDIFEFILKNSNSEDIITLKWFGGEPLYNVDVIDLICSNLENAGRKFKSTIVTNGYLFDQNNIEKALKLWNLKHVQITLDGTENVYNRCKNYIYKSDVSPFQIVINNIKKLVENEIDTSIRLNIGLHNADDLYKLVDYLHEQFGNNEYLSVYVHPLFDYDDNGKQLYNNEDIIKKNNLLNDFDEYIKEKGLLKPGVLRNQYNLKQCMADSDDSIVITPDGSLSKCEHYSDTQLIGNIYNNTLDYQLISDWKVKQPKQKECYDCAYYIDCIRLKKCPNYFAECDIHFKESQINRLKNRMIATYEDWKKSNTTE